eukprot:16288-Eustigmatos_ZCMA.PRE.1
MTVSGSLDTLRQVLRDGKLYFVLAEGALTGGIWMQAQDSEGLNSSTVMLDIVTSPTLATASAA